MCNNMTRISWNMLIRLNTIQWLLRWQWRQSCCYLATVVAATALNFRVCQPEHLHKSEIQCECHQWVSLRFSTQFTHLTGVSMKWLQNGNAKWKWWAITHLSTVEGFDLGVWKRKRVKIKYNVMSCMRCVIMSWHNRMRCLCARSCFFNLPPCITMTTRSLVLW